MWIDIDKQQPEEGETVLFLEPFTESLCGDVRLGFFIDGEWFDERGGMITGYISHWMAIPNTAKLIDKLKDDLL